MLIVVKKWLEAVMNLGATACFIMRQAKATTRKPLHLVAILRAGRRDVECQQMAQRIDAHGDFRALLALAPVIAGALAALGRGPRRPAVDDRGGRLDCAPRRSDMSRHKEPAIPNELLDQLLAGG